VIYIEECGDNNQVLHHIHTKFKSIVHYTNIISYFNGILYYYWKYFI